MEVLCTKHNNTPKTFLCETCKITICQDCKTEHDQTHSICSLQDLSQKLMLQLSKEDDVGLYKEICKLDDELNGEVDKLKKWFETIEKKVVDVIHECMNEVMNEVLEQTNVKLGKKKKQMEEALKLTAEEREKIQDEIKDIVMDEKYENLAKYKDLYFQIVDKQKLFMSTASSKPMWIQHVKKVASISEEFLKENVSNALKHVFNVPLLYIMPNKTNQILTYDLASKKKVIYRLEGLQKSRHFDTALIKNCIFIIGGHDEENKVLLRNNYEYEILEKMGTLRKKADLIKGRFGHKAIAVTDSFVYALGGIVQSFLGTKYTNHCEKYDRVFDRWVEVKPMYESKGYMSACHFKERFIYVFGGFSDDVASESSSTVEFFDTMIESEGWKIVKFTNVNKKWMPISQAGVVQLGRQMLLLFGGRTNKSEFTSDCYLYNIKDNTMKQLECKIANSTAFYQRHIATYNDEIYAFDSNENNLHIFDPVAIKWNVVKRTEWDQVKENVPASAPAPAAPSVAPVPVASTVPPAVAPEAPKST